MSRLDAMDGQRRRQQLILVDQVLRRSLVGGDAGVFQCQGHLQESGGVGVAEVVRRFGDRLAAEVGDDARQRVDVQGFVLRDGGKGREHRLLEAEPGDAGDADRGKTVAVERGFNMLERQRVVENVDRARKRRFAFGHRRALRRLREG